MARTYILQCPGVVRNFELAEKPLGVAGFFGRKNFRSVGGGVLFGSSRVRGFIERRRAPRSVYIYIYFSLSLWGRFILRFMRFMKRSILSTLFLCGPVAANATSA